MRLSHWLPLALALAGCGSAASPEPRSGADTAPRSIAVGDRAPRFELTLVEGGKFANTTGHPTVLVFWATWSEPDKKELIALEQVWRTYAPRGVRYLAIAIDDDATQLPAFALTYHLTVPIAWDAGRATADAYRPQTDPTTYLVDADGKVRAIWSGYHGEETASLRGALDDLLLR